MKSFLANAEVRLAALVWFAYIAAIIFAELCVALGYVTGGVAIHAALVLLAITWRILDRSRAAAGGLSVLVLAPLLRLLSLTVPANVQGDAAVGVVAVSVVVCAALLRRGTQPRRPDEAGRGKSPYWLVVGVAVFGVPMGVLAAASGVPISALPTPAIDAVLFTATMYFLGGAAEEYVFRGVIQPAIQQVAGAPMAIVVAASAFAAIYVGWLSLWALGYAISLGLFFGAAAYQTRSTAAVMVSHGLLSATAVLVHPLVLR